MGYRDDPVGTARDILAGGKGFPWPAPLIAWLRHRSHDLALDWVFRIAPELIRRSGSPDVPELLGELVLYRRWREAPPPSSTFSDRYEEMWRRRGNDRARTALCHLCEAVARVVCPDMDVGINWLWRAVAFLCEGEVPGEPSDALVEWCIADFRAFVAANKERADVVE